MPCHVSGPRRNARPAHTLLELIMATAITSIALVPALALFRDGMDMSIRIDRRNAMASLGVDKLEEQLAVAAAAWLNGSDSGDFAARGYPHLRYQLTRSDSPAQGGIPARLMDIAVIVYDDEDRNNALGTDEPKINFRSRIARLATYENEAS